MPKNTIITLGLVVAILPFLGFPNSFKAPVIFLLGIGIAYASFYEHHRKRKSAGLRRIHRRTKGAVTVLVGSEKGPEPQNTINLVEPNEENSP